LRSSSPCSSSPSSSSPSASPASCSSTSSSSSSPSFLDFLSVSSCSRSTHMHTDLVGHHSHMQSMRERDYITRSREGQHGHMFKFFGLCRLPDLFRLVARMCASFASSGEFERFSSSSSRSFVLFVPSSSSSSSINFRLD
jgi:hypothetical protein